MTSERSRSIESTAPCLEFGIGAKKWAGVSTHALRPELAPSQRRNATRPRYRRLAPPTPHPHAGRSPIRALYGLPLLPLRPITARAPPGLLPYCRQNTATKRANKIMQRRWKWPMAALRRFATSLQCDTFPLYSYYIFLCYILHVEIFKFLIKTWKSSDLSATPPFTLFKYTSTYWYS